MASEVEIASVIPNAVLTVITSGMEPASVAIEGGQFSSLHRDWSLKRGRAWGCVLRGEEETL